MHALHHFSRINWDSLCLLMKSFSSFLRILYIPTKNQGHIYSNLPFRLPLKLPQSVLPGCGHLFYNSQSPVSAANWDQNCVGSNPSSTTHWQRCAGHSMFFGFLFFSEDWRQKYLLLVMLILQHREKKIPQCPGQDRGQLLEHRKELVLNVTHLFFFFPPVLHPLQQTRLFKPQCRWQKHFSWQRVGGGTGWFSLWSAKQGSWMSLLCESEWPILYEWGSPPL